MSRTIGECMADGGAYSSYLRAVLATGETVTRKADVACRLTGGGRLTAVKYAAVAKSDLAGEIVRIGFTDAPDGDELLGGAAETVESAGGELAVIVSASLSVPMPRGWQGNEAFFDVLTGTAPPDGAFTAVSETGETAAVEKSFGDDGMTLTAAFAQGMRRFTLLYDGAPCLECRHGGTRTLTATPVLQTTDDIPFGLYDIEAAEVTSSRGATDDLALVRYPTALGEERRAPLAPYGTLRAYGDVLALASDDGIRVYGRDLRFLASRACEGLIDFCATENGVVAVADRNSLRVFRGGTDLFFKQTNATAVAISDRNGALRLRYVADGALIFADIGADGSESVTYSAEGAFLALAPRCDGVFALEPQRIRLISSAGETVSLRTFGSNAAVQAVGCAEGLMIVRRTSGSCAEIIGRAQRVPNGAPKSVSGRLYLTESGGERRLYLADEKTDRQICALDAEEIAYAHGRLYYTRGGALYYREGLDEKAVGLSENAYSLDTLSYTATGGGQSDGACAATVKINIGA